jgi:anti-sigma regulatory factor (Ser/Thr protein kinase)
MRRLSLQQVAAGGPLVAAELAARRRLLPEAAVSVEELVRGRGSFLSERVTERLRVSCLEQPEQVALNAPLLPLMELGLEDAIGAVADKTAAAPAVTVALTGQEAGCADVVAHLLRFAVAELAKNAFAASIAAGGETPVVLRAAASSGGGVIVRLENAGELSMSEAERGWFRSGAAETPGYAYGGGHGAALAGLGVGLQMAACALRAFGASVALTQRAKGVVAADIVLLRRQPFPVI